jgi:hypothetical protein
MLFKQKDNSEVHGHPKISGSGDPGMRRMKILHSEFISREPTDVNGPHVKNLFPVQNNTIEALLPISIGGAFTDVSQPRVIQ